jgi:hypothetical protein
MHRIATLALILLAAVANAGPHYQPQEVPPGHLPPPGQCRVWYDGEPPGHQPLPMDCANAETVAALTGGRVIYGEEPKNGPDEAEPEDNRQARPEDDRRDRPPTDAFNRLDRNDDDAISSNEWTGDKRIFDHIDRNDDGRLRRNELQGGFDRADLFRDMDANRNGRLSRNEWWGGAQAFKRMDQNDDGSVSRKEFLKSG